MVESIAGVRAAKYLLDQVRYGVLPCVAVMFHQFGTDSSLAFRMTKKSCTYHLSF